MAMGRNEFQEFSREQWRNLILRLFSPDVPRRYSWTGEKEILKVLNEITKVEEINHTFLPPSGGLDLFGATPSVEQGCIELYFGEPTDARIVRPRRLLFESFDAPLECAYFRLEAGELAPSGVHNVNEAETNSQDRVSGNDLERRPYELVTEVAPGQYVDYGVWESGYYGSDEYGYPSRLPKEARAVIRYLRGTFLIVCKGSPYNLISGPDDFYSGRHDRMNADKFRRYAENFLRSIK